MTAVVGAKLNILELSYFKEYLYDFKQYRCIITIILSRGVPLSGLDGKE